MRWLAGAAIAIGLSVSGCADDGSLPGWFPDRAERCAGYETAYLALMVSRDSHNADQASRLAAYEVFLTRFCGGLPETPPAAEDAIAG